MNKTTLFLILTFGISISVAGLFYLLGGSYTKIGGTILAASYMFIPTISVFIVEKLIHKNSFFKDAIASFKINKWFLVAWLLPPALSFGAFAISLLFPNVSYTPDMSGLYERYQDMLTTEQMQEMKESLEKLPVNPLLLMILQGIFAGVTINALFGLGEELGWRRFLVQQFEDMHFLKATLLIGFIWGIWHAPLILMGHNYPQNPIIGVFMMIAWCILLSPIFLYITLKAKSVIAAAILHGTINGTVGLSIILVAGGSDLIIGLTGLAGFITLIIAIVILLIYDVYFAKEQVFMNTI